MLLLLRQRAGYGLFILGKLGLTGLYLGFGIGQLFLVFLHLGLAFLILLLGVGQLDACIGQLLLGLCFYILITLLAKLAADGLNAVRNSLHSIFVFL